MKILIATNKSLVGIVGGTERVLSNFANEMHKRGHDVYLAYCTKNDGAFCYPVDADVKVINLLDYFPKRRSETLEFKFRREILRLFDKTKMQEFRVIWQAKAFYPVLQRLLQQVHPDVVISAWWDTSVAFFEACREQEIPLITMSHLNAENLLHEMTDSGKRILNQCAAVQVLMPHDKVVFSKAFPDTHLVWIPNVVPQYPFSVHKEKLLINVSQLAKKQKRQHLLIETFSLLADQFSDWTVEFWGDENGKSKYTDELKELIRKYHLEGHVKLCGRTDDVLSVYRRASIFAFPSAYEGFSLAMAEAMSAGLPVVAYRSCPAVNELVRDGETGLLVDDGVEALAEGLKKLMKNQELRERMGRAAHESMKEFAPEKIWDQWEALMKDVISKHKTKMER